MTSNSGFTSSFNGTEPVKDIITSVSDSIVLPNNMNGGGTYYGRYFCLGDLLIQFTDFSQGINPGSSTPNTYFMNYPIPYTTTPYTVIVSPYKKEDQNFPVNMTIVNIYSNLFTFNLSNRNGEIGFIVIGPRPSNM